MAKQQPVRSTQEQGMLKNIAGHDEPAPEPAAPEPAAPSTAAPLGWMGYVGGVLWAMVLCGAGLAAWLVFAGGA